MSHPFDASTKFLVDSRLADWLALCGRSTNARVELIDADLSTVTALADRVLCIHEQPAWLLHLELQSSRDPAFISNLPVNNTLLERRHGLRVRTVVVALRPAADSPELSGIVERAFAREPPYLVFRYQVVRLWQLKVETFLNGGLGILPLAPLSDVRQEELPGVIARMRERIAADATTEEAGVLWTAADVLMGLRYPRSLITQLMRGIHGMKDSVTYQAIVEEGEVKKAQQVLLKLGAKRFGPANEETVITIRSMTDLESLEPMIDRLLEASSWQELLGSSRA